MARKSRTAFMDALMAEPVRLAGCPDIILTRHDAYRFYVDRCGMDPKARGFASPEYLAFNPTTRAQVPHGTALTDLSEPWAVNIMAAIARYATEGI